MYSGVVFECSMSVFSSPIIVSEKDRSVFGARRSGSGRKKWLSETKRMITRIQTCVKKNNILCRSQKTVYSKHR